jgi:hypothetical protein
MTMPDHDQPRIPGAQSEEMRENVYRVPDGYFNELPGMISDRISDSNARVPAYGRWSVRLALAGLAGLVLSTGIWYFNQHQEMETVTPQLTYDFLVESGTWYELDEHLIVEELSDEVIDRQQDPEDNYDDYLIEHNTDINLIINEL